MNQSELLNNSHFTSSRMKQQQQQQQQHQPQQQHLTLQELTNTPSFLKSLSNDSQQQQGKFPFFTSSTTLEKEMTLDSLVSSQLPSPPPPPPSTFPSSSANNTNSNNNPTNHTNNTNLSSLRQTSRSTTPTPILTTGQSSEQAIKRRHEKEHHLQMEKMNKQLETVENKNLELIKIRKKLLNDLEIKNREIKFYEKQCYEQQQEIQILKGQLESTIRVSHHRPGSGREILTPSAAAAAAAAGGTTTATAASIQYSGQQTQQQLPKLIDELKHTQDQLGIVSKENTFLKEGQQELLMKIKILQDALTFRSEEIGLSGHSDLLLKVSQLKGEITALKKELINKKTVLETTEKDKSSLMEEQKSYQEQITAIQERLAKAQQENYRLSNNDLGILLKTTEQERDLLLEYIEQNLNKNILFTKQIETLEQELKISQQKNFLLSNTQKENQELLEKNQHTISQLENDFIVLKQANKELSHAKENYLYENESLQKQLSRKLSELEETEKIQATLYTQLRAKDEELLNKSEELILYKTKIQEYETILPLMKTEIQQLKQKLTSYEQENKHLSQLVHELEPKLQHLEPLVERLQTEMNELEKIKKQLENENYQFKYAFDLVNTIDQELSDFEEGKDPLYGTKTIHSATTTPVKVSLKTPLSLGKSGSERSRSNSPVRFLGESNMGETINANRSDIHSRWIGLPSIRKLNPKLFEKMRNLSQDLYRKEIDLNNLQSSYQKLQLEHELVQKDFSEQLSLLKLQNKSYSENIQAYALQMKELEKSLFHSKELGNIVSQIKTILKSYSPQMKESFGARSPVEKSLDDIKDINLPDYLQNLLLQFSQISYAYHETMVSIEAITKENLEYRETINNLKATKERIEKELKDFKDNFYNKENYFTTQERQYYSSVEQATELTEKQNALLMTLEAKVESLQRDRQIQKAQVHSLQQREETLKQRLISEIEKDFSREIVSELHSLIHKHRTSLTLYDIFHFLMDKLFHCMATNRLGEDHFNHSTNYYNESKSIQKFDDTHDLSVLRPSQKQQMTPNPNYSSANSTLADRDQRMKASIKISELKLEPAIKPSNNLSSATITAQNPLQERLRKAQQAFAAMKDTIL